MGSQLRCTYGKFFLPVPAIAVSVICMLCCRDTVGTERFDSITTQYYRGGAVCSPVGQPPTHL